MESPITGSTGKKTDVSIHLTDDKGAPIPSQMVNISYIQLNQTYTKTAITDQAGNAQVQIKLPDDAGAIELTAVHPGKTNYLSAVSSKTINVVPTTDFPLFQIAAVLLLIGGVAGILILRGQQKTFPVEIEDMELVHQVWSDRLNLYLPEIDAELPAVWGVDEPLVIQGKITTMENTPSLSESLTLLLNETKLTTAKSNPDGVIRHVEAIPVKGVHRLILFHPGEELRTVLDIKIVDYREEIIRLFNNRFKESREMFQTIKDNYTARELYEYLREQVPEVSHEPLRGLVFIFEEANYSLHEVNRSHYTRFFHAMRKYKEALNGEDS
jgi:hypothetical protein